MERIRHRADFLAAAGGARTSTPAFLIQRRQRDDQGPVRIGFTVTRKVGTAVERNRVRRRLRNLVRQSAADAGMRSHCDYVVVGRRPALYRDFDALRDDLRQALQRLDGETGKKPQAGRRTPGAPRPPKRAE